MANGHIFSQAIWLNVVNAMEMANVHIVKEQNCAHLVRKRARHKPYSIRIIFLFALSWICMLGNAQVIDVYEVEEYATQNYGKKSWSKTASLLADKIELDKNNTLVFSEIIECGNKTKEQLFVLLNYWMKSTFSDSHSVVQLDDKDAGTIICQGYVRGIAEHDGGINHYLVSIKPVIKFDIKDYKIRVTYSVKHYEIERTKGLLLYDGMSYNPVVTQKWMINRTYPFYNNDNHKLTSSKAFVLTVACSDFIMDRIEEAVTVGLIDNEKDDW